MKILSRFEEIGEVVLGSIVAESKHILNNLRGLAGIRILCEQIINVDICVVGVDHQIHAVLPRRIEGKHVLVLHEFLVLLGGENVFSAAFRHFRYQMEIPVILGKSLYQLRVGEGVQLPDIFRVVESQILTELVDFVQQDLTQGIRILLELRSGVDQTVVELQILGGSAGAEGKLGGS